jgi:hypothetical protein
MMTARGGCHLQGGSSAPIAFCAGYGEFPGIKSGGAALVARNFAYQNTAYDVLGVCAFAGFSVTLDEYANTLNDVTGLEMKASDLETVSRRVLALERLFNLLCGFTPENDWLPDRFYREPVGSKEMEARIPRYLAESPATLVKGHGPFVRGGSLQECLRLLGVVDASAKLLQEARVRPVDTTALARRIREAGPAAFFPMPGRAFDAAAFGTYDPRDEATIRAFRERAVFNFVQRICPYATGSMSEKTAEHEMLYCPTASAPEGFEIAIRRFPIDAEAVYLNPRVGLCRWDAPIAAVLDMLRWHKGACFIAGDGATGAGKVTLERAAHHVSWGESIARFRLAVHLAHVLRGGPPLSHYEPATQ